MTAQKANRMLNQARANGRMPGRCVDQACDRGQGTGCRFEGEPREGRGHRRRAGWGACRPPLSHAHPGPAPGHAALMLALDGWRVASRFLPAFLRRGPWLLPSCPAHFVKAWDWSCWGQASGAGQLVLGAPPCCPVLRVRGARETRVPLLLGLSCLGVVSEPALRNTNRAAGPAPGCSCSGALGLEDGVGTGGGGRCRGSLARGRVVTEEGSGTSCSVSPTRK